MDSNQYQLMSKQIVHVIMSVQSWILIYYVKNIQHETNLP